jgi:magnesium transporter
MMSRIRKPPVGSKPGTLTLNPNAETPRLSAFIYDENAVQSRDSIEVAGVRELLGSGRKLWVDVQGLGDERVLRELAEIFAIHPLALEDVVHVPVRPKAEAYEQNLLIVTRMIRPSEEDEPDIEQMSLFIGVDYVVTFQERYGDVLDPVRDRLHVEGSRLRTMGSDYLGYAILDTVVDGYYPSIEAIGDRVEDLEDEVLSKVPPDILQQIHSLRSQLLGLRRAIVPQRESMHLLLREENTFVSDAVQVYLRDTTDHIVQASEAVEQARERVSSLMNMYLTIVSNRMNDVMKTLTIIASIFVPLTFIAGIYGMNFERMPELGKTWGYPLTLGVMGTVAGGMVFYFWRKGWIGRRK